MNYEQNKKNTLDPSMTGTVFNYLQQHPIAPYYIARHNGQNKVLQK